MKQEETILISEIFGPTIQGEGVLIGQPTVFVRTAGCDYHCTWCDSPYAVDGSFRQEWLKMTAEEILHQVEELAGHRPLMVSLSGGNPALQPLARLLALGKASGYTFTLETQGSIARDWFAELDLLTLSPKPPSSGMDTDPAILQQCLEAAGKARVVLKFVIHDQTDYLYARTLAGRFPLLPVYVQPCNIFVPESEQQETTRPERLDAQLRWLVDKVLADHWHRVRVLPQLHVLLWGNRRGV